MQMQVITNTKNSRIAQCRLIDVKKRITDGKVRKNHKIDFPQQLSSFHGIDLFMELVRVVEECHGCIAIGGLGRFPFGVLFIALSVRYARDFRDISLGPGCRLCGDVIGHVV